MAFISLRDIEKTYFLGEISVPVLKGIYGLEKVMEIQQVVKSFFLYSVIFRQQFLHPRINVFGRSSRFPSDLIRQFLVVADSKPVFAGITCPVLQNAVELFYETPA